MTGTEMPILDERNTSTSILNPITIPCIHCELDDASDKPHLMHFLFIVFFCVGCYYASYGYRYFRSSMFLYGFNFAVIFVYTLCSNGDIMPEVYNKFLAAFAGFVLGIIAVLVQSLGLFITGLHTGVLKGAFLLILFSHVYATDLPSTYWISIIVCFVFGMITASMNVIWKKGLTIVSTSVYGGALVAISLDHFLEDLAMVKWLYKRAMLEPVVEQPCTLSWMIFAVWPVTTLIGIFVQTFWTGTGIHHDQGLAKQRRSKAVPLTRQQKAEHAQRKYRYLYQMRTAHGDVISQSYVQALHQKKNTAEPWSTRGVTECSTLQSDSTHLTVLAADTVTQDSDTDEVHPTGASH